jgi:hypothetical protein
VRLRNPLARPHAAGAGRKRSVWVRWAPDEDLAAMIALSDAPVTAKTIALHRSIKARALRRMHRGLPLEVTAVPEASLEHPTDFASWFSRQWSVADSALRGVLRKVAGAAGLPVPTDPPEKMRRTIPPPPQEPPATQRPSIVEPTISPHTHAQSPQSRDGEPDDRYSAYWTKGEGAWGERGTATPCASLFDALHDENRGWD